MYNPRELFVYVLTMSDKLSIKKKLNTEVKKKSCQYFRQIKTVKQIMALNDMTTQNSESAPANLKLVKKRLF